MSKVKTKKGKTSKNSKKILELDISFGLPSLTQRVLFAKNMAIMLQSGMTVIDALHTTRESLSGRFKSIISKIIEKVESGVSLSESFSKYPRAFPEIFVSITQAGESSGTLSKNLTNISNQLKKERDLKSKIQGAMIYPIIILIASFFLGITIAFFILPEIIPIFEGLNVDLPATTKALIAFTGLVESHGTILLLSIIIGLVFIIWLAKQKFSRPITHWLLIKTPIIRKIVKHANLSRFANTLGTSLKSGISVDESLEISCKSLNNYYYKKSLDRVAKKVRSGTKLSDGLGRSDALFPILLTRMIKVGEESGKLEDSLLYLSDFYEEEVDMSIKTFTTMLEPILLLFVGSVVGFLALSIISPIYDITGNVQR